MNPILKVLASSPIDRKAAIATSQRRCSNGFLMDGKEDMCHAMDRLDRKRRLIESILRITTDSQRDNVKARFKAGRRQTRPRRIVEEYVRIGQNIQALGRELACINVRVKTELSFETKAVRKALGARENQWKEENPGWIWAGSCHIAPNGSVFLRADELRKVKEALHA